MAAANARQTALRQLWLDAPGGQLSARTQAFAWALREAWQADRESTHGMLQFVADRVTKANGEHPSAQAVADFFSRIDEDDEWWPGKTYGRKRGRKRALSGLQRAAIARSAMRRTGESRMNAAPVTFRVNSVSWVRSHSADSRT